MFPEQGKVTLKSKILSISNFLMIFVGTLKQKTLKISAVHTYMKNQKPEIFIPTFPQVILYNMYKENFTFPYMKYKQLFLIPQISLGF